MARVGVPDLERAEPQRLTVSMTLQPGRSFGDLGDDLSRTIDYAAVCENLRRFVAGRARQVDRDAGARDGGTFAEAFPASRVELELRKFVLPETRHVAVRVVRQQVAER